MLRITTLVQASILSLFFSFASADEPVEVRKRIQGPIFKSFTSKNSLFFNPQKNNVTIAQQQIDYDASADGRLRLGPYRIEESEVSMQMTSEMSEYYEIDVALGLSRRFGSIYVLSFNWPENFIESGYLEIVNDQSQALWRKEINADSLANWKTLLSEQINRAQFEKRRDEWLADYKNAQAQDTVEKFKRNLNLARPQKLSLVHRKSRFGVSQKEFDVVPFSKIIEPFRFCISQVTSAGHVALCSARYKFMREAGRFKLEPMFDKLETKIMVNDKIVSKKGSAIFLDNKVPIKFAARLHTGTYVEFISHPKDFTVVDVVKDENSKRIEIIGYGEKPTNEIEEVFNVDYANDGWLNFMPTIGDFRQFWRTAIDQDAPYFYVKGESGFPFRQSLVFNDLPSTDSRVVLNAKMTQTTYNNNKRLKGSHKEGLRVGADSAKVEPLSPTEFNWYFPAPQRGEYNISSLNVIDGKNKWRADYSIYRGYPGEVGVRASAVVTNDADWNLLGELATQYWFEKIFGIDHPTISYQRWGLAARRFQIFLGNNSNISEFAASNFDLKYRLTPGIWERDPTLGLIASVMQFEYGIETTTRSVDFQVPVAGGGVFWARSMPRYMDDVLNLLPFMRYPKWVDWEFLFYPVALESEQKSRYMFAMNFHGKVLWRKNIYGDAGFGLKNFSFEDKTSTNSRNHLAPSVVVGYATLGLGINF